MEKDKKPTWKTTEFIKIAVIMVAGLLLSFGVFNKNQMLEVVGFVGAAAAALTHHFNRTGDKRRDADRKEKEADREEKREVRDATATILNGLVAAGTAAAEKFIPDPEDLKVNAP